MKITKILLFFLAFQAHAICTNNAIIVLYGCSSVGKTSISSELNKMLPGNWKYIPANKFSSSGGLSRNCLLWKEINRSITCGYNVMVDTHNPEFLIENKDKVDVLVVMLHCSPDKLIEHIDNRNTNSDSHNHRKLKTVFSEFCSKYKKAHKNDTHVTMLRKDELQNNYGFLTSLALRKIIKTYFDKNQQVAYIAPCFNQYDCFVDTGKLSICACAQKIKNAFILKSEK